MFLLILESALRSATFSFTSFSDVQIIDGVGEEGFHVGFGFLDHRQFLHSLLGAVLEFLDGGAEMVVGRLDFGDDVHMLLD